MIACLPGFEHGEGAVAVAASVAGEALVQGARFGVTADACEAAGFEAQHVHPQHREQRVEALQGGEGPGVVAALDAHASLEIAALPRGEHLGREGCEGGVGLAPGATTHRCDDRDEGRGGCRHVSLEGGRAGLLGGVYGGVDGAVGDGVDGRGAGRRLRAMAADEGETERQGAAGAGPDHHAAVASGSALGTGAKRSTPLAGGAFFRR